MPVWVAMVALLGIIILVPVPNKSPWVIRDGEE